MFNFDSPALIAAFVLGIVGSVVAIWAFLPQMIKVVKTQNTDGISALTFAVYSLANWTWALWALLDLIHNFQVGGDNSSLLFKDLVLIVTNIPCAIWPGVILIIKLKNIYLKKEEKCIVK